MEQFPSTRSGALLRPGDRVVETDGEGRRGTVEDVGVSSRCLRPDGVVVKIENSDGIVVSLGNRWELR